MVTPVDCLGLPAAVSAAVAATNLQLTRDSALQSVYQACRGARTRPEYYNAELVRRLQQVVDGLVTANSCRVDPTMVMGALQAWHSARDAGSYLAAAQRLALQQMVSSATAGQARVSEDLSETVSTLLRTVLHHCPCRLYDLFTTLMRSYGDRLQELLQGMTEEEQIQYLEGEYQQLIRWARGVAEGGLVCQRGGSTVCVDEHCVTDIPPDMPPDLIGTILQLLPPQMLAQIGGRQTTPSCGLVHILDWSLEGELDTLVPDELGPMKEFFIRLIVAYYTDLPPILWGQILAGLIDRWPESRPFTQEEVFAFVSGQLLSCSGPFILKILQAVRPALSPELARKYNLTRLRYPLLAPAEVEHLLRHSLVIPYEQIDIIGQFSASVGHVCKVQHRQTGEQCIIKFIKPVAVSQSCAEYSRLCQVYEEGTCEREFVLNMLQSNGYEMDLQHERTHVAQARERYWASYEEVFGLPSRATLRAVDNIPGVIREDCQYAMAMSLAPGVPLSSLVEDDLLAEHTVYRAALQRAADLLVYTFFAQIISTGFYHGDLHAGNVFYDCHTEQMTVIDWGAVGELDIWAPDPDVQVLVEIMVRSVYYQYDIILDLLATHLNTKCSGSTQIDLRSPGYRSFRDTFTEYRIQSLRGQQEEARKKAYVREVLFTEGALQYEARLPPPRQPDSWSEPSLYSGLGCGGQTECQTRDIPIHDRAQVPAGQVPSLPDILTEMVAWFAGMGVNVAVKFSGFSDFQKAYALLLGVLHKIGYSGYRLGIVTEKALEQLARPTWSRRWLKGVWRGAGYYRQTLQDHRAFVQQLRTGQRM